MALDNEFSEEAGIQTHVNKWIPASAGMTAWTETTKHVHQGGSLITSGGNLIPIIVYRSLP